MAYMMIWGRKGFAVSSTAVTSPENFTTSYTLKQDANSDTSNTPAYNTTGRELQQITFETVYALAAGTDPLAQYEDWCALLGEVNQLILNGRKFGSSSFQLTNVSLSDVILAPSGGMISARVAITLTEYRQTTATKAATKTQTSTTASTTTAAKTTTTSGIQLNKVAALSATPSSSDKEKIVSSAKETSGLDKATTSSSKKAYVDPRKVGGTGASGGAGGHFDRICFGF